MTIWKYPLAITDRQTIDAPYGAKPLAVMIQNGVPCLWMQVDPVCSKVGHLVAIYGTGHTLPNGPGEYAGSFMIDDGTLVFHVYVH